MIPVARISRLAALVVTAIVSLSISTHAVTIDWVTVGDPGNAADTSPSGYGAVAESFRIGKYEVTIQQYTDFLNAAAKSDPYSLYDTSLAFNLNSAGISRAGSSGSYIYSVIGPSGTTPAGASSPGNRPITYVSWFDAARFANWMHNGQGSGSTETGAYTLVGGQTSGTAPARNPGAQFYIPTEDQWYKAAYYKSSGTNAGYWNYATQTDTDPGNLIGSGANQANYNTGNYTVTQSSTSSSSQNYLTDVGAFSSSVSAYGTFDQSGNVFEWNDLTGTAGSLRGRRGGGWMTGAFTLSSGNRIEGSPSDNSNFIGFRLASPAVVPEPSTYCMALAGLACGGYLVRRRRKRACNVLAADSSKPSEDSSPKLPNPSLPEPDSSRCVFSIDGAPLSAIAPKSSSQSAKGRSTSLQPSFLILTLASIVFAVATPVTATPIVIDNFSDSVPTITVTNSTQNFGAQDQQSGTFGPFTSRLLSAVTRQSTPSPHNTRESSVGISGGVATVSARWVSGTNVPVMQARALQSIYSNSAGVDLTAGSNDSFRIVTGPTQTNVLGTYTGFITVVDGLGFSDYVLPGMWPANQSVDIPFSVFTGVDLTSVTELRVGIVNTSFAGNLQFSAATSFDSISVVPEPQSLGLLGTGGIAVAAGLISRRRIVVKACGLLLRT